MHFHRIEQSLQTSSITCTQTCMKVTYMTKNANKKQNMDEGAKNGRDGDRERTQKQLH